MNMNLEVGFLANSVVTTYGITVVSLMLWLVLRALNSRKREFINPQTAKLCRTIGCEVRSIIKMVERYHQGVRQGHQEHHGAQQEDHVVPHESYYTSDSCVTVIIDNCHTTLNSRNHKI